MGITEPTNMREYYKYYLTLHKNKYCRRLHFIGQCVTILYIFWVVKYMSWLLLIFTPFVIYPFAWSGHYFFEKNEPAAFSSPLRAKISDWMMFRDILLGKIKI